MRTSSSRTRRRAASVAEGADETSLPRSTTSLSPRGERALRRFIERLVDQGFRLAVVEVWTPVERQRLEAMARGVAADLGASVDTVDISALAGENIWRELHERFDSTPLPDLLLLWGLEETAGSATEPRPTVYQQLNIQRDSLTRDLAVPWILFVHPHAGKKLHEVAPDFADIATLWLEAPRGADQPAAAVPGIDPLSIQAGTADLGAIWHELSEASRSGAASWLVEANRLFRVGDPPAARDALARFDLGAREATPAARAWRALIGAAFDDQSGDYAACEALLASALDSLGMEGVEPHEGAVLRTHAQVALASLDLRRGRPDEALDRLEHKALPVADQIDLPALRAGVLGGIADVLQARGRLEAALAIHTDQRLPLYERLGDLRSKAVTLGKISEILQARGQLDEALEIRTGQQLPIYERLGDVREKAVTLAQIADHLQARGLLDEALTLLTDEALPVFERLGDVRSLAVTRAKIADNLQARGQLDEALAVLADEALPIFQRLDDIRSAAVIFGKISDVLQARGLVHQALAILAEAVLPVFEQLGDIRNILVSRAKIAVALGLRGRPADQPEIARLLLTALADAERSGFHVEARWIRRTCEQAGIVPQG
ncbi:MAG: hypothetical protein R3F39_18960 [Myxococcota bacterium]